MGDLIVDCKPAFLRKQGERSMANEDRIIAVYMMANRKNGAIYTGVTSHLVQRTWQHREGTAAGFTKKQGCKTLVWYEVHEWIENPHWKDLWFEITG